MRFGPSLAALALSACATVTSTCPVGTKPVGGKPPLAQEQYCVGESSAPTSVPTPGGTFESTLGLASPTQLPGGVSGPYTSYYADGTPKAHGEYADFGARSVPDGIWGFWYASGKRRALGEYKRGVPTGCFAVWNDAGARQTGFVEGTELHAADCAPPSDETLLDAEGRSSVASSDSAWADLTVRTFLGGGAFGARNTMQVDPNPKMNVGLLLDARAHLGRFRVGSLIGYRTGSNDYSALTFGASGAFALPSPHPRLDLEVGLDVEAHRIDAYVDKTGAPGDARLVFWLPNVGAQFTTALALTPILDAVIGARVDGSIPRNTNRDVTYCDFATGGCLPTMTESWHVGGATYGITAGLRLSLH